MTSISKVAAYSVVAGVGMSAGRDGWKAIKKMGWFLLFLFCTITLPYLGARGLVWGHDRGFFGTLFKTIIFNIILILSGFSVTIIIASVFGLSLLGSGGGAVVASVATASVLFVPALLAGLIKGLWDRRKRVKAIRIKRLNDRFLINEGIEETNGKDITHYDSNHLPLRFLEQNKKQLIFMLVGKRGKRAFIDLDNDGQMQRYYSNI